MVKKKEKRERIAVFYQRYVDVIKGTPQVHCPFMKGYSPGEIIWDESEIERFLKSGAPVGVYYRDVN